MILTPLADTAYVHWKKYLPKMVEELRREGKLKEVLEAHAKTAENEMAEIRDQMMRNSPTPKTYHENLAREYRMKHVSEEIVLPRYILMPPEDEWSDE